jgi:hypothetical protein
MRRSPASILLLAFVLLGTSVPASAQHAGTLTIEHWREVLRRVERELKQTYYDPTFNGVDIEARFKVADAKMKNAASMDELRDIVAQVLIDLNDTHTFLIPPTDGSRVEYGWRLLPVGPDSYVGAVKPGSDAYAKGCGQVTRCCP